MRPTNRGNSINQLFHHRGLMPVGGGMANSQGRAAAVDNQMPLRARLATIGWVRSRFLAPLGAGTLAASSEARSQSIWSVAPR